MSEYRQQAKNSDSIALFLGSAELSIATASDEMLGGSLGMRYRQQAKKLWLKSSTASFSPPLFATQHTIWNLEEGRKARRLYARTCFGIPFTDLA